MKFEINREPLHRVSNMTYWETEPQEFGVNCATIKEKIQAISQGIPVITARETTAEKKDALETTMSGYFEQYRSEFEALGEAMEYMLDVARGLIGDEYSIVTDCGDEPMTFGGDICPPDEFSDFCERAFKDFGPRIENLRFYWRGFLRCIGTTEGSITDGDLSFEIPELRKSDNGSNRRGRDETMKQIIELCDSLAADFSVTFNACVDCLKQLADKPV